MLYRVQYIPGRADRILMCSVEERSKTKLRGRFSRQNLPLFYGELIYFHYTMPKLPYSCGGQAPPLFDEYQRKVQYQLASEFIK